MAISGKYGKVDIPGVGADEPVFILRAQDMLSQGMVEIYRVLVESHGCKMKNSLQDEINRFSNWQGKKKMPD